MKPISMGEIKCIALIAIAYGLLCAEDYTKKGFVNRKITKNMIEIKAFLKLLIGSYAPYKADIHKKVDKALLGVKKHNKNLKITTDQTALCLLFHTLEPCERTFKKLPEKAQDFWNKYRDKVLECSYAAHDTRKYFITDYDSDQAAYLYIKEMLSK